MNTQTNMRQSEPWSRREELPRIKALDAILACVAVLLSSVAILLCGNENASFLTLLGLSAFGVIGMRRGADLLLLLLAAFAVSLLTTTLGGASLFLGLVIGAAALAYLITTTARPYAVAIPLAVSVGAWLVTKDLYYVLLALSVLPAGVLLAVATLTHQRRTTAICCAVGGYLISLAAILALLLYREIGSLEIGAITSYLEGLHKTLQETLFYIRDEFFVYMREALAAEGVADAEISASLEALEATMADAVLSEVLALFFAILPALAVILASVVGFEAQLLLSHCYFYRGWRQVLTADATVFSMSVTSAVLYILTFIGSVFLGVSSVFGAALQNMCMILLPGLCVMGVGAIKGMLRTSRGASRFFIVAICCGSIFCVGFSALYFLALWGAYSVILAAIGKRMLEKLGGNGQGRDNGNGEDG